MYILICSDDNSDEDEDEEDDTCDYDAVVNAVSQDAQQSEHEAKKRKNKPQTTDEKKILKLTSGSSAATVIDFLPQNSCKPTKKPRKEEDCGTCKFCKDKKKFGGNGTLKKKCIYK